MKKEIIVKWRIKESETPRILQMLPELAEKSKSEAGNAFYAIYQSETDPNELILHECYRDDDAAEAHKRSDHYQRIVVHEIIPHLDVREVTLVKRLL
jgi:(4S)-4-hydroxy-5-phosphonooxypentane-2,3-dione isomerase